MSKKLIIFSLFLLAISPAFATDPDTNYVQTFKNIFAIKGYLINNGFTYTITPRNNSAFTSQQLKDARIVYTPYIPPTVGISINVKGIGLSYVFKIKNDFWDTIGRVKSDFQQFNLNIYKINFGFEAYYQDYRRFYYHYLGDQLLYKNYNSDIRSYQFGANAILIPNGKRFSYNAAFNQTVFQKKSAGSFLFMFSLKFNEIKSDQLIPDSVKYYYGEFQYTRNRNYAFLIYPGYAFNITKKNFYLSAALLAGVGIQNQTYLFTNNKDYKISFPISGRGKAAFGYNGKVVFSGIYGNIDMQQTVVKPVKTQQMIYSYGIYAGFRFVKYTKTKGQLKEIEKRKRLAEKEAQKKADEEAKAKKKQEDEAKKKAKEAAKRKK